MIFLQRDEKIIERRRGAVLRWASAISFILALALALLTFFMMLPQVQQSLDRLDSFFLSVEMFIARFDKLAAFGVVMLLFATKSFVSVIPFSVLFVGTGLVFPVPAAVLINALGYALFANIKFSWSRKFGGGKAYDVMMRFSLVKKFMALEGKGNGWTLLLLNSVPCVPLGTLCRAYGATEMDRRVFTGLAVAGFLPRLVSWSIVGRNMTQPFTVGFTMPIIFLLIISGASLLLLDTIFKLIRKEDGQ